MDFESSEGILTRVKETLNPYPSIVRTLLTRSKELQPAVVTNVRQNPRYDDSEMKKTVNKIIDDLSPTNLAKFQKARAVYDTEKHQSGLSKADDNLKTALANIKRFADYAKTAEIYDFYVETADDLDKGVKRFEDWLGIFTSGSASIDWNSIFH